MATMQRLYPFQNAQFGSKLKISKNMPKTTLEAHQSCSMEKAAPKTANIRKKRRFQNLPKMATMQKLQPLQNALFGSKVKITKNTQKTTREAHQSCCMEKAAPKTANIRKKRRLQNLPKMATMQRLQPLQNAQFGSKLKISKSMPKTILEAHQSCSIEKAAPKAANIRKKTRFQNFHKMATMKKLYPLQNAQFLIKT